MKKKIKFSDTKAVQVQTISIKGQKMISLRQFYATVKDPTLRPGRQGISIPFDEQGKEILKAMLRAFKDPNTKFTEIESE